MISARIERQVHATMPARMGLLGEVSGALSGVGVNVSGISAYERDGIATFLLVTEDIARASAALGGLGAQVSERSALAIKMPDQPGALQQAAARISAAGINIFYVYGTSDTACDRATVVFKTADDEAAAALFAAE